MAREKKGVKEKQREKIEEDKNKKRYEKETRKIIFIMIAGIIFFLILFYFYKSSTTFYFYGMKFQKIKAGNIEKYRTTLIVNNVRTNFYLRHDPRKLLQKEEIEKLKNTSLRLWSTSIISFDPITDNCYGAGAAGYNLGNFLLRLGITPRGATTSEEIATAQNKIRATCKDAINKTVIVFFQGNISRIEKKDDCYKIEVKDCEIIEASEKFMLFVVLKLLGAI